MAIWGGAAALVLALALQFATMADAQGTTSIVPAMILFGDSAVDSGNNNYFPTAFKANYLPYGKDFISHQPTGRFCNGKLATDITADILGFKTYPPAYLSPQATGKNLLVGANFGSAAAGYDDNTAIINHAIPLSQQLEYYKEYRVKLAKVAGSKRAAAILKGALYLVGFGTADFLQNYYVNPSLKKLYTPDQYSAYLATIFSSFIKDLYGLGARKIGVVPLPPLGCFPETITMFRYRKHGCIARINKNAQGFNNKINTTAISLQKKLPALKIVVFDIFMPLHDVFTSPSDYGFAEARKGCCQTRKTGTVPILCDPKSPGTCRNASQYVFWDDVHLSQATNQMLAESMLLQGISLI